jgi:hypothetical protein
VKAFYFARPDRRLAYGDGRIVAKGTTHTVDCTPRCCERGLHASLNVFDALKYSESSDLWLVDLSGSVDHGTDKVSAQSRKYIDCFNMEELLWEFARKQAQINILRIAPYCSSFDYELICEYLSKGCEHLRSAAYSAARSAAYSSTDSSAWSAACSAACSADRSAAYSAAYSAADSSADSSAWYAAWYAADFAARSAADSSARDMLQRMVLERTGWTME